MPGAEDRRPGPRSEGAPSPVTPTGWRELLTAALLGALLGLLTVLVLRVLGGSAPVPSWQAAGALGVSAVALLVLARAVHQQLQVRRERVEPARAVLWLALAKAAALGGAVVTGGYAVYGLAELSRLVAELPRQRLLMALLTSLAGVALVVAGLRLERACRVPADDDQEDPEDWAGEPPRR